jgi:hypothetical protein
MIAIQAMITGCYLSNTYLYLDVSEMVLKLFGNYIGKAAAGGFSCKQYASKLCSCAIPSS